MGQIGKYIDEQCRDHPHAMRGFLDREIGSYFSWTACLVGSIRRARGQPAEPELLTEGYDRAIGVRATRLAYWIGARTLHLSLRHLREGLAFYTPEENLYVRGAVAIGSARITALVKKRVRRRLEPLAMPVVAQPVVLPEHVLIGSIFRFLRPTRREVAVASGFEEPLAWHPDEVGTASPAELTPSG